MKLTNRYNLPLPIVRAIENDPRDPGNSEITVTGLVGPPRISALIRQHAADLEEDVSEHLWRLLGSGIHEILARYREHTAIVEKRLFMEIMGWKISGQFDTLLVSDDELSDWKTTSVYKVKAGCPLEWTQQLNLYTELLVANGYPEPRVLSIHALLRDWSKREALRDPGYPPVQWVKFNTYDDGTTSKEKGIGYARLILTKWSPTERRAYLESRVRAHQIARVALPDCTAEERWERPAKWAVMKPPRDRAVKLFDSFQMAEDWRINQLDASKMVVQERKGQAIRCESYCVAAPFCSQWQSDPLNPKSGVFA